MNKEFKEELTEKEKEEEEEKEKLPPPNGQSRALLRALEAFNNRLEIVRYTPHRIITKQGKYSLDAINRIRDQVELTFEEIKDVKTQKIKEIISYITTKKVEEKEINGNTDVP